MTIQCGCGEQFLTYKEYKRHQKRFHQKASAYFIIKKDEKPSHLYVSIQREADKTK
jgi:hypothetical protein